MNWKQSAPYLSKQTGIPVAQLQQMAVPADVAAAVGAVTNFKVDKNWQWHLFDWLGKATKPFMRGVTLPWPAYAGRNLTIGQYINGTSGLLETLQDAGHYGQKMTEGVAMLRTGKIDPALEAEIIRNSVFQPSTIFEGVQTGGYSRPSSVLPGNPLDWRDTYRQASQAVDEAPRIGATLNAMAGEGQSVPFADRIPELMGPRKVYEALLGTGAKLNQQIEFLNRVPMYKYLREKGWTESAAAAKVKELQVDYSRESFSPFENEALAGRLVPFYKWNRKMAPHILDNLLEHPAGVTGQIIRASRLGSDSDASTPDYVSEGLAIPNPFKTAPEGGQSFIAGSGLPHEQFAQYVGGPRAVGRELLSQTNPLLKGPLEWATNQSFFQSGQNGAGRALDDMDPTIGRTLSNIAGLFGRESTRPIDLPDWLEHAAVNSPASRFLTTGRQLTDPRKGPFDHLLNMTTGARVVDVSPGARDAVLRDRSTQLMKDLGAHDFTRTFFSKDDLAAMSPEQRAKAERLIALQTALAGRAKDRVKQKKAAAQSVQTATLP